MGAVAGEELMKLEKMQGINSREEKILVLVRLRPLNEKEIMANEVADWECINDTSILYRNTLREGSTFPSAYTFDRVFRGECSTKQVYEEGAREIAFSVVSGINSSIFAYGQTSSGKTYTMDGIIEYSVADIFDYIRKHEERAFVVKFSAIEIYNEAVRDLLSTDSTPLRLLDDHERGTIVEKVTEETLRDWNHLKELLSVCEAQRRIGETSLNEKSSRSHQIIKLTIESSAREFLGKDNSTTLAASVNFIDLAGSERAAQALSAGARLKEGCHINRSLLTLGTVIRKLSKGRNGHINYRDSKLTRILQPCLGGNARTAIVCTLSPARSHVEQTRNTLLFACCAKEVTTKAQVNVVMSDKALVKHLQKELARLESELRTPAPVSSSSDYAALLKKKDLQIEKLAKENRELTKQRDLAQSRIEDLLRMVGHDDASRKVIKSSHSKLQARDALEDEGSGSETSSVIDSRGTDMGGKSFNNHYSDGESDDGKRFLDSHSGHSGMTTAVTDSRGMDMGGKSSNSHYYDGKRFLDSHSGRSGMTTAVTDSRGKDMGGKSFNNHYYDGKRFLDSHSGRSGMTTAVAIEEDSDDCKEVQCIEMEESIRDDGLLLHAPNNSGFRGTPLSGSNYGNMVGHEMISTAVNGNGEVRQIQNNSTNDQVEQGLRDVRRTAITSTSSPYCHDANSQVAADMSSSRSWRRRENLTTELPPDKAKCNHLQIDLPFRHFHHIFFFFFFISLTMATPELSETYACMPSTERGRGILISGHPKTNSVLYTNGRSVMMLNLDNPLEVSVYAEHGYPATVARYSPNGEWIASADVSGVMRLWGTHSGFVLKNEYKVLSGRIDDLQWSPDGMRIVACGEGKGKSFVRAFMWDSGSNVGEFDGHSRRVLSCAFKPTRPFRIATCGEDFLVNFYEGPPFRFKQSLRDHSNFVNCIRFSPDGSKFISVSSDKKGIIYDAKTADKIGELSSDDGHKGSIYAVSWSPDGKQVLTVSADKTAKVWGISDEGNGTLEKTLTSHCSGGVDDMLVGCLWQNQHLVTVSLGGTISLFSASDLDKSPVILFGHMKNVTSLVVLKSDPKVILSTSYDGRIIKWIQGIGYSGKLQRKENSQIKCLAALEDELVTSGFDNKVWRVSIKDGQCGEAEAIDVGSQPKDLTLAAVSPELALVSIDTGVVLLRGSNIVSTINLGFTVTASVLAPDGSEVIVGGQDGKLHIYSVADDSLTEEATIEKHRGAISVIRYSPDLTMFASGDLNREAIVWDRATREVKLKNMLFHTARINCLDWSPDNTKVATGSLDTCVIIYEVDKPASSRLTVKGAHLGGVYGLAFTDDYSVVSSGEDACVRVWKLAPQ